MLRHTSILVSLVRLIERFPWPPEPAQTPPRASQNVVGSAHRESVSHQDDPPPLYRLCLGGVSGSRGPAPPAVAAPAGGTGALSQPPHVGTSARRIAAELARVDGVSRAPGGDAAATGGHARPRGGVRQHPTGNRWGRLA
jgi:hypothetical protein